MVSGEKEITIKRMERAMMKAMYTRQMQKKKPEELLDMLGLKKTITSLAKVLHLSCIY